ncbi:putative pentatricopeptide repeat-containing protein [Forsythia ovata]|uniref:Pentatricopeptide repeat-containing protein n=1 Tax=Forsythia ovata TaxID=205694 RepID=A0ABD1TB89_9LAMI
MNLLLQPLRTKTRVLSSNLQQIKVITDIKWNIQLRELSKAGKYHQAITIYCQMLRSGATPNPFTFPFILKSSAALSLPVSGTQIHCHVIKFGFQLEPFVQTALTSMYCKCWSPDIAYKLFDESPKSWELTVCYNALISGYVQDSQFSKGLLLFREMRSRGVAFNAVTILGLVPGCTVPTHLDLGMSLHCLTVKCGLNSDLAVANCFLTMYVRCGSVELARKLFDEIPRKGLITWNAMVSGYAQNGLGTEVLNLYRDMELLGMQPDAVTFVGVLSSCANLGAQKVGIEVEEKIEHYGLGCNRFLKNALINMYARCGNLARARSIFDKMPEKNLVSWTAIISGYGMHGHGEIAVELFDDMIREGIQPDETVFVSVLSACSHAGLTKRGIDYFDSIEQDYGLKSGSEHYSCVVDLLGRAGQLQEAYKLIKSMPMEPDGPVWGALLGACKIHKNVKLAEVAFTKVVELEPTNIGYYVLLSNIYTEADDLAGVMRIRVMMRERKLKKDPGYSYVEYKGITHLFVAGDRKHPQTKNIYTKLAELEDLAKEDGGLNENEEKKRDQAIVSSTRVHSERLAIAFALLNTDFGKDILVIKNLRICGECHVLIKSFSKILDLKFVVRDATRFHHFKSGECSCKDYW